MSLLQRHVELYEFVRGPKVLRATSGDRDVVWTGQNYAAVPGLSRNRLSQSATNARTDLELTAPRTFALMNWFANGVPGEPIEVRLRRVRVSDGADRLLWSGVLSASRETTTKVELRAQTLTASLAGQGLRRCWQVSCPFTLYGTECGVDRESFRVPGTLSGNNGYVISSAAFAAHPDGWFDGGMVRWNVGTDIEHRWIVSHVGTDLMLLTPASAGVGAVVDAFPGCDHSMTMCDTKFGNAVNYGGQHTLPKKDPFDGRATF